MEEPGTVQVGRVSRSRPGPIIVAGQGPLTRTHLRKAIFRSAGHARTLASPGWGFSRLPLWTRWSLPVPGRAVAAGDGTVAA